MEQKELERSEKSVLLENILNSVPEEAASSDVEEPNENGGDTLEDSDTETAGDAEDTIDAGEPSDERAENTAEHDYEEFDGEEDEDYEEVPKKLKKKKRGHGHIIFGLIFSVVIISVSILAAVFILDRKSVV